MEDLKLVFSNILHLGSIYVLFAMNSSSYTSQTVTQPSEQGQSGFLGVVSQRWPFGCIIWGQTLTLVPSSPK